MKISYKKYDKNGIAGKIITHDSVLQSRIKYANKTKIYCPIANEHLKNIPAIVLLRAPTISKAELHKQYKIYISIVSFNNHYFKIPNIKPVTFMPLVPIAIRNLLSEYIM